MFMHESCDQLYPQGSITPFHSPRVSSFYPYCKKTQPKLTKHWHFTNSTPILPLLLTFLAIEIQNTIHLSPLTPYLSSLDPDLEPICTSSYRLALTKYL